MNDSIRPSVCLSDRPSVCLWNLFLLCSCHQETSISYYQWHKWGPCKRFSFRTVTPVSIHIWRWNGTRNVAMMHMRGAILDANPSILTQMKGFRTLNQVWIHWWLWNDAQSLNQHRRDAVLFFKVICQIQGHTEQKIADCDPNLAFPDCNSSLNSPVDSNTLRPRQNGRHFADDIFKCIFGNENVWIPIKISLKFASMSPINNFPSLVQIMAWHREGNKPLSEPMMVSLLTHICVTRPQWVKWYTKLDV